MGNQKSTISRISKVTISGRICTGKTTLFWGLQDKLGWPTFSASHFFRDYARTHNLSLEKAEEQSAKFTKEFDNRTRALLQGQGNLITEGWMVGIMADELPGVLRVLLVCDDKVRVQRFAKREAIILADAQERIKQREQNLFAALAKIYQRQDYVDPKNYNFVLDTTALTRNESIKKVLLTL